MNLIILILCRAFDKRKLWMVFITTLISLFLIFGQAALAQDKHNEKYISKTELKKYLTDKYDEVYEVTSRLRETADGPEGSVNIRGKIAPKIEVGGKDKVERSRALSKAFIQEETTIFGVIDSEELKEFSHVTDNYGNTHIKYHRYIEGLRLDGVTIFIHFGLGEDITSFSANLVPVPQELYDAVKKKTITENDALKIVKQDLESDGIDIDDLRVLKINKIAIVSSPYVVWEADVNLKKEVGRWLYKVDAFTGEIIEKADKLIF